MRHRIHGLKKYEVRLILTFCVLGALSGTVFGKFSEFRRIDSQKSFLEGDAASIRIDPFGRISTGWKIDEFVSIDFTDMISSILVASDTEIYFGSSPNGKIFRIIRRSSPELVFDSDETSVTSLAMDSKNNIFSGTGPGGRVFKISPDKKTTEFYATGSHYVWSMAIDKKNRIWIACGDPGQVICLSPDGSIIKKWQTRSQHVRQIKVFGNAVWFCTADPGMIYQIDDDDVRLLYESTETEINSLVMDDHGDLYFSTVNAPAIHLPDTPASEAISKTIKPSAQDNESKIYRLGSDGIIETVWLTKAAPIFDLAFFDQSIVALCGSKGYVFKLERPGQASFMTALLDDTAICSAVHDDSLLIGGSSGQIYTIPLKLSSKGSLKSKVFKFDTAVRWGRISIISPNQEFDGIEVFTRSGNRETPDEDWSHWVPVHLSKGTGLIDSPPAQFFQWKIDLDRKDSGGFIDAVEFSLIAPNRSPSFQDLTVYPVTRGTVMDQPGGMGKVYRQEYPDGTKVEYSIRISSSEESLSKKMWFKLRGMRTVAWQVEDPDSDQVVFSIEISPLDSDGWTVLESSLPDPVFSFDSSAFPDGIYLIRVTASDQPSNPHGSEKKAIFISKPFTIDNTPPVISDFSAVRRKDQQNTSIRLTGRIEDKTSRVLRMEYSFDAENWFYFSSKDSIVDSSDENFDLSVMSNRTGNRVFLRVSDENENTVTGAAEIEQTAEPVSPKGDNS